MGSFAAGQVVLLPFPYSDLSRSKLRPAVLVADASRGDWIACQITSNPYADSGALMLTATDFRSGGLQRVSFVRPLKLVTGTDILFHSSAGWLHHSTLERIRVAIIAGIAGGGPEQEDLHRRM